MHSHQIRQSMITGQSSEQKLKTIKGSPGDLMGSPIKQSLVAIHSINNNLSISGGGGGTTKIGSRFTINAQQIPESSDDVMSSGMDGVIVQQQNSFNEDFMMESHSNLPLVEDSSGYFIQHQHQLQKPLMRSPQHLQSSNNQPLEITQSRTLNQTGVLVLGSDTKKRIKTEYKVDSGSQIPPLVLKVNNQALALQGTNISLRKQDVTSSTSVNASNSGSTVVAGVALLGMSSPGGALTDHLQNKLIAKHQMNMTIGPGQGGIGPQNSFLTVKNAVNNGNSKNNNKAYMQHIKSADEVMTDKRGAGGGAAIKSDATTAAESTHINSSLNQKSNDGFRQQQQSSFNNGAGAGMLNYQPSQVSGQYQQDQSKTGSASSHQHQASVGEQAAGGHSRQAAVGQNKSQKPPISMQSAVSSSINTPQDTSSHKKGEVIDNLASTSKKQGVMNKRIAISITQVGLQGPTKHKDSSANVDSNGGHSNGSYTQTSTKGESRQQRFSNTMAQRGQSVPSDKFQKEDNFQLPDVNAKQQLQSVQSQQNTPIPKPKKSTIIIPNNTFHYVIGSNQMGGQNQLVHTYNKFPMTTKMAAAVQGAGANPGQVQIMQQIGQSSFTSQYAARFGYVTNPHEYAAQKKKSIKDNQQLMITSMHHQNANQQPSDDGDREYFYNGQFPHNQTQDLSSSNPLGFSPMIKRLGEQSPGGGQQQSMVYNMSSPFKSAPFHDDPKYGEGTPSQGVVTGSSPFQLRNRQTQEKFYREPNQSKQQQYEASSTKKDLSASTANNGGIFNTIKSRSKLLENEQQLKITTITDQYYANAAANSFDQMRQSYLIQESGVSDRGEGFSPQKPGYVEGCGFEGFDQTQYGSVQQYEIKGGNKFNIELHPASPDTEKAYQTVVGGFQNNMAPSNSDAGFVKAQSGFAIRKGQLVKTHANPSQTQSQFAQQFGQQGRSPGGPIRSSTDDGASAGLQGGKVSKSKNGGKDQNGQLTSGQQSPNKGKTKQDKKGQPSEKVSFQSQLKQQPDQTDLQLEQAFQSILNQRAERLGAVKNYTQIYQKKQAANFLNIQRIEAPNPNSQAAMNANRGQLQSRGNTENTGRLKQNQSVKITQGYRQNIMQEKYMEPETQSKFGLTKRLMFKRRHRMKDKNLVILFFDGVIGDLPYTSGQCLSFNTFRIRQGAINDLRNLCYQSQVVLVMPYMNKRSQVITRYLHKFATCPFDAVYSSKVKEQRSSKKGYLRKWQDYEQIYRDFNLDEPSQIMEQVLVIGCYTSELELNSNEKNPEVDLKALIDWRNPEILGVSCLRSKNEVDHIRRANPLTLLVPHLDLEIGSLCSFQSIIQSLDLLRGMAMSMRMQHKGKNDNHGHHYTNHAVHQEHMLRSSSYQGFQLDSQHFGIQGSGLSHGASGNSPSPNKWMNMTMHPAGGDNSSNSGLGGPRISFLDVYNYLKRFPGHSVDIAGAPRTWKLKCMESVELQKAVLQHEKLGDHLKMKNNYKRQMILDKYKKEDGTVEVPTYEDLHPECTLYQYGALMNENMSLKNRAIDEYKRQYLDGMSEFKGAKQPQSPGLKVPHQAQVEFEKDPSKSVPMSEVRTEFPTDTNSNHRFFFLIPSSQVVQRLLQTGPYQQAYEYIDIIKELADNVPADLQNLIATTQNSFEIQDWICRKMFTRPQNNGFIGPSGLAKRRGISYIDADFQPTPAQIGAGASVAGAIASTVMGASSIAGNAALASTGGANNGGP